MNDVKFGDYLPDVVYENPLTDEKCFVFRFKNKYGAYVRRPLDKQEGDGKIYDLLLTIEICNLWIFHRDHRISDGYLEGITKEEVAAALQKIENLTPRMVKA